MEGSSHGATRPNTSAREGAGRPRWAGRGDRGVPGANTDMKPQLHSFPGSSQHIPSECTHCASPWGLSVISSHACYWSQQHCWPCQGLQTYFLLTEDQYRMKQRPRHPYASLRVPITNCNPFRYPHSLLGYMKFWLITSLSYLWGTQLSLLLHLLPLMSAVPIATCHQSVLELRTSFFLFLSLLCSSQFFTPVSTWELLSSALNHCQSPSPILLVLSAQPCSVTHIPSVQPSGHAQCADGVYR